MKLTDWRKLGGRLAQMDGDELRDRVRQEVNKREDGLFSRFGIDFALSMRKSSASRTEKFFFDPASCDSVLEIVRNRLPEAAKTIVQHAEKICTRRFDLLGYKNLDFGDEIDWHLDPVHGKRSLHRLFYKIRYLDFNEAGDSKITWELNRHQHFVTLAKAYRITGKPKFAEEISRQWHDWQAKNPYPVGINWASSLEAAFRSLAWLWTYHLLEGTAGLIDSREEWLCGLALHGRHLERYLSTYFSPNTHLLGEGVGLFFIGVLCPEIDGAERWKRLGWKIILRESERQILCDGFHFERSTYYHVYALDFFLHSIVLASVNDIPIPQNLEQALEKMLTALCSLARYGSPPRLGDDDGGRLFDPSRNRGEHLSDPLAAGAILFRRGDFKHVAGDLREETLWLLGAEGARQWDRLEDSKPWTESVALRDCGLYLLSSQKPAAQLVFDAGPLGTQSGGHGHADAMGICLQSGTSLLIDPGTYRYIEEGGERGSFRGTALHNTLRVDETNQAETTGPFSWKELTKPKVERWIQGPGFDFVIASHDGYQRLAKPVIHRRHVFSLKNGVYLVRDMVEGEGMHRLDISWHLGQDVQLVDQNLFRVKGASLGLALLPAAGHGWAEEVRRESWSPVYGQKAPMTVLNFSITTDMPMEFGTLIHVLEEVHPGTRVFEPIAGDSTVHAYRYAVRDADSQFFFAKAGQEWVQHTASSDAEFVCWQQNSDQSEWLLILCNGSYTRIKDGPELRCRRAVQWCEMRLRGGERTMRSSDPEAVEASPAESTNGERIPTE
jgi:Heparinase II/III-like protein/Heparinase II/III N-terminus